MQVSQTNTNAGDVNTAVSEKGAVIQTTGTGNKVRVENPKESPWGAIWETVKKLWSWVVGKRR